MLKLLLKCTVLEMEKTLCRTLGFGCGGFWNTITSRQVGASYQVTFGVSLAAGAVDSGSAADVIYVRPHDVDIQPASSREHQYAIEARA